MQPFDGLSILLLEDEYLIAVDAEQSLTGFGVARVKIVNSLQGAAEAAGEGGIDVAILDININGETSYGIAKQFRSQGIPVIFASGYGIHKRDAPDVDGAIYLSKPYTREALRDAVAAAQNMRRAAAA
jgi:CheY-like chemotaxis protein